jgi:hypothetical protein
VDLEKYPELGGGGTVVNVETCSGFGGGECEGREGEREEHEVSEDRDRRRPLVQHQAKNTSSISPPMLTPMMMPPACSRRMPVSIVVAAASSLFATAIPFAFVLSGCGTVTVTHAAVVNVVNVADCRSDTRWVSTLSSSCIGRPSKTGLPC